MRKFNVFHAPVEFDETDPSGYASGGHRFGPDVGGNRLGASIYELPPGQSLCPYHYESDEEWLLVLAGEVTLRHPDGEDVLEPGDVTAFPAGPAGAHKTTNNGTTTARLMMFSTNDPIGYCVYPDSNKMAVWTDSSDPEDRLRVRRGENLEYFDGEV